MISPSASGRSVTANISIFWISVTISACENVSLGTVMVRQARPPPPPGSGRPKNSGRIVSANRSGSQYRLGKSGYVAPVFNLLTGMLKSANGLSARMAKVGTPPPPPCHPPPCQPPPCQPPPCQPPPISQSSLAIKTFPSFDSKEFEESNFRG